MIFRYITEAKTCTNLESGRSCLSPINNGVAGVGFLSKAIRSNAAYYADRSCDKKKGTLPWSGKILTALLSCSLLVLVRYT